MGIRRLVDFISSPEGTWTCCIEIREIIDRTAMAASINAVNFNLI